MSEGSACRKALFELENLHERNGLVQSAVKAAAEEDEEIQKMAEWLAFHISRLGRVSALELLAAMGWWLLENENPGVEAQQ